MWSARSAISPSRCRGSNKPHADTSFGLLRRRGTPSVAEADPIAALSSIKGEIASMPQHRPWMAKPCLAVLPEALEKRLPFGLAA